MSKIDIKIIQVSKNPFKDLQASKLVLNFKGNHVFPSVTNSLRRLAFNEVPTYAFIKESINIEENSSIFDNDYMRNRLEQFTIPGVNVPVVHLVDKYWRKVDYSDKERERHPDDNVNIEMVLNERNNTASIQSVTTNNTKLYQDGEDIKGHFDEKYPLLIIKLKTGQVFKCTSKAVLGKGYRNNIWSSIAQGYHDYDEEHDITLTLESQGQLDEYDILVRSCMIMKHKIQDIKEKLEHSLNEPDVTNQQLLLVRFDKEDHTFGEILNEFLQDNNDVIFSGVSKPDLLKNEIVIKMKSVKNNPLKPLFATMDYVVKIYEHMEGQFRKLGGKFVNV
jgi:DNA-directed RNA polymerase subunit L